MGLRKTDGMAEIPVSEWNRREAIRCIRNRIVIRAAWIVISANIVFVILCILHQNKIINFPWW